MAPLTRLEQTLSKLGVLPEGGGSYSSGCNSQGRAVSFCLYFPKGPFDGMQFGALSSGQGFNFTGQLLGIGGRQLQRIQHESGARVEVRDAHGNLNGAHPNPLDPELHALVTASSLAKLHKAVAMVRELLEPLNARFNPVTVTPGGSARLTVQRASRQAAAQPAAAADKADTATRDAAGIGKPASADAQAATSGGQVQGQASPPPVLLPITPGTAQQQAAVNCPARTAHAAPSSCSSVSNLAGPLDASTWPPATEAVRQPPAGWASCAAAAAAAAAAAPQQRRHGGSPTSSTPPLAEPRRTKGTAGAWAASPPALVLQPPAAPGEAAQKPLAGSCAVGRACFSGDDSSSSSSNSSSSNSSSLGAPGFQYGLGLRGSRPWGSRAAAGPSAAVSKASPALQTLLDHHQRLQQAAAAAAQSPATLLEVQEMGAALSGVAPSDCWLPSAAVHRPTAVQQGSWCGPECLPPHQLQQQHHMLALRAAAGDVLLEGGGATTHLLQHSAAATAAAAAAAAAAFPRSAVAEDAGGGRCCAGPVFGMPTFSELAASLGARGALLSQPAAAAAVAGGWVWGCGGGCASNW